MRSRYTGKERDTESGLDYFGARYYASSMGRFSSPDPSGLFFADPTNPQSLNLYSYVRNNPLSNIDPDGLRCVWDDGSFDSEDDKQSGKQSVCEAAGGTYHKPGEYSPGVDWGSSNADGTLTLHTNASAPVLPKPTLDTALSDLAVNTLIGKTVDLGLNTLTTLIYTPQNRQYPTPSILFGTKNCGKGGDGSRTGPINGPCATHDDCYTNAGIDANGNFPGGPEWTLPQAAAAQGCNQGLYNAARSNPNAPGSKAIQYWLTHGDTTPFGYVLKPGTEAKPW